MIKQNGLFYRIISIAVFITIILFTVNLPSAVSQTTENIKSEDISALRTGVHIMDFTGNLSYYNVYRPCYQCEDGLKEEWQTQIKIEFRNIAMLNPQWGIGYKAFISAVMAGLFEGGGLGGIGAGPLIRFYPFKTIRWQPYLQAGVTAGYNLGLGRAAGIADVSSFRFRTFFLLGITYRTSQAFGLFLETGRKWEYERGSGLQAREWAINIGIELFLY